MHKTHGLVLHIGPRVGASEDSAPIVAATSTITVDLTAPVTTPTVDGTLGRNGWWTAFEGSVLTLTATDNLTGVVVTYYTINGGAPQVYTGPISLDHRDAETGRLWLWAS